MGFLREETQGRIKIKIWLREIGFGEKSVRKASLFVPRRDSVPGDFLRIFSEPTKSLSFDVPLSLWRGK